MDHDVFDLGNVSVQRGAALTYMPCGWPNADKRSGGGADPVETKFIDDNLKPALAR